MGLVRWRLLPYFLINFDKYRLQVQLLKDGN